MFANISHIDHVKIVRQKLFLIIEVSNSIAPHNVYLLYINIVPLQQIETAMRHLSASAFKKVTFIYNSSTIKYAAYAPRLGMYLLAGLLIRQI
ncbi:hypothetical protein ASB62_07840 [Chlorobium limicola]|uniref:Uncharacterized protein n=1 Tax=Chlorobium limicola TaxID=1092 RepID=A0A101J7X0_CHLLI|nr:hypothetical protein ASB62_07840 [Chlorobium limicola]